MPIWPFGILQEPLWLKNMENLTPNQEQQMESFALSLGYCLYITRVM